MWRLRVLPHSAIVYDIILAGFKFGDFLQNRQFAKLKTSPKFTVMTASSCCMSAAAFVQRVGNTNRCWMTCSVFKFPSVSPVALSTYFLRYGN